MNTKTSFFTYWTKRNRNIRNLHRSVAGLRKAHFDTKLELLKCLEYRILKAQNDQQKAYEAYLNLADTMRREDSSIKRQVIYPAKMSRLKKQAYKLKGLIQELKEQYARESQAVDEQVQIVVSRLKHTPHPQFAQSALTQKVISPKSHYRQQLSPDLEMHN